MKRLAEALLLKREVTAGVRICSSLDMLENLLEIGEVQALLISDEIPYELRKRVFGGRRIVLTRTKCADLGEEEQELRKYQSVDKLTAEIMQAFQKMDIPAGYYGKGRVLGVYSPVHRVGKTTFALKLGKVLAEQENVLYLNLEAYAGIGGYFQDGDVQNLSHLLYYAKQEKDDIGVRIASMIRQMGNLDYIPPMKVWSDLREVSIREWEVLLQKLTGESIYDTVILDLGNAVGDIFEILKLCDWILFPFANDVYARTKMEQYSYILKALRLQELEMHTIYVDMDKTMRQAVKEAAGELEIKSGKGHMYVKSRTTS